MLTNYHVIAPVASGGTLAVEYSDGERSPATVVGSDPATDLAVIKAADGAADRPLITARRSPCRPVSRSSPWVPPSASRAP